MKKIMNSTRLRDRHGPSALKYCLGAALLLSVGVGLADIAAAHHECRSKWSKDDDGIHRYNAACEREDYNEVLYRKQERQDEIRRDGNRGAGRESRSLSREIRRLERVPDRIRRSR